MAWLNTAPKPDERSKRAQTQAEAPRITRAARMKRDKLPIPMPPNPLPHVIDRLLEIGLTEAAGMGAGPLSWGTIADWQAVTGVALPSWEARLIRKLSVEYVAEQHRAESEHCPPPWQWEISRKERDIEEQELRALLG